MSGFESAPPTELAVLTPSDGVPTGAAAGAAAAAKKPFSLFGEDGFSFADLIDIINPLQHIPLVSTLYRHLTGDVIDAAPRVLGGTLFGGPIGAIVSLINVFVEESTGKDMGEHAVALFTDEAPPEVVAVARNTVPEARFETAAGATRRAAAGEPLASDTDAIVATVRANRFAVASVAPMATMVRSEPLAPPLALVPPPALGSPKGQQSAAARQVASATTALRQGERQADAFAMLRYRAALRDADEDKDRQAEPPMAGATAAEGGWFSDAMLSGLGKYDAAVKQAKPAPRPSVDLSN